MLYEEIGQRVTAWQVTEDGTPECPAIAQAVGGGADGGRIVTIDGNRIIVPVGEFVVCRGGYIFTMSPEAFTAGYRAV